MLLFLRFEKNFFHDSASSKAASVVALKVRKIPMGKSTIDEIQAPRNTDMSPFTATHSPMMVMT